MQLQRDRNVFVDGTWNAMHKITFGNFRRFLQLFAIVNTFTYELSNQGKVEMPLYLQTKIRLRHFVGSKFYLSQAFHFDIDIRNMSVISTIKKQAAVNCFPVENGLKSVKY